MEQNRAAAVLNDGVSRSHTRKSVHENSCCLIFLLSIISTHFMRFAVV